MAQEAESKNESVAYILRSARQSRKLALDSIAKDICVRRNFLEAIEEGRFADLPEMTFAIGFVKSYAKVLKLDAAAVAARFKTEFAHWRLENGLVEYQGASDRFDAKDSRLYGPNIAQSSKAHEAAYPINPVQKRRWPAWVSPIIGLVGAGMSWMLLGAETVTVASISMMAANTEVQLLESLNQTTDEAGLLSGENISIGQQGASASEANWAELHVADHQQKNDEVFAAVSLFTPAAHASNHVPAGTSTTSIMLQASEDSWIQLSYKDGTELWSGILRAGQTYRPQLVGDVYLTTSNAGGILLKHHDTSYGPLGDRGTIVEALALDAALFSSRQTYISPDPQANIQPVAAESD